MIQQKRYKNATENKQKTEIVIDSPVGQTENINVKETRIKF